MHRKAYFSGGEKGRTRKRINCTLNCQYVRYTVHVPRTNAVFNMLAFVTNKLQQSNNMFSTTWRGVKKQTEFQNYKTWKFYFQRKQRNKLSKKNNVQYLHIKL